MVDGSFHEDLSTPQVDLVQHLDTLGLALQDIVQGSNLPKDIFETVSGQMVDLTSEKFDNDKLVGVTDSSLSAGLSVVVSGQRASHLSMYRNHKKVLLSNDEGELVWADAIHDPRHSELPTVIKSAPTDDLAKRSWLEDINTLYDNGAEIIDAAARTVTGRVSGAAIHLQSLAGELDTRHFRGLRIFGRWAVSSGRNYGEYRGRIERAEDQKHEEALRQAEKLADLIRKTRTDFPTLVADEILHLMGDELKESVTSSTNAVIAQHIYEVFGEFNTRQPKRVHIPRLSKTTVAVERVADTDEKPAVREKTLEEGEVRLKSGVTKKEVGLVTRHFPWMGTEALPFKVTRYSGAVDVYVVHASSPKLAQITANVENNFRRRTNNTTVFDEIVEKHAERAASGINPSANRSSVKRVMIDAKDMRPQYKGIRLWSSFITVPNAPRVFYELESLPEDMIPGAKPNSRLMVVISKHDKANELDVLAQLSTRSRAQLRALGAGSI